MSSKKIVLFIVEGLSEQTALALPLSKIFDTKDVQFFIVEGDITSDRHNSAKNIAKKISKIVKDFAGRIYDPDDFLQVVHLIDTDGAFVDDSKVSSENIEKYFRDPYYKENSIVTRNIEGICKRNFSKSQIIDKLLSISKVWSFVPYCVYYFSCNLDHVLYDEPNLQDELKYKNACNFLDKYVNNLEGFKKFFTESKFSVMGNYENSWKYIQQDCNSLQRNTNFGLCFDLITSKGE